MLPVAQEGEAIQLLCIEPEKLPSLRGLDPLAARPPFPLRAGAVGPPRRVAGLKRNSVPASELARCRTNIWREPRPRKRACRTKACRQGAARLGPRCRGCPVP